MPFGATTARLIWATSTALPFVGMAIWLGLFSWQLLALPVTLWLGTIMGWQGSLDLARNEGHYWRDFAVMTARGLLWTLPTAALLTWVLWPTVVWPLLVAGALCAVLYEIAWRMPQSWKPPFAPGPEMGELFFGAAVGLSMAVSLALVA